MVGVPLAGGGGETAGRDPRLPREGGRWGLGCPPAPPLHHGNPPHTRFFNPRCRVVYRPSVLPPARPPASQPARPPPVPPPPTSTQQKKKKKRRDNQRMARPAVPFKR